MTEKMTGFCMEEYGIECPGRHRISTTPYMSINLYRKILVISPVVIQLRKGI